MAEITIEILQMSENRVTESWTIALVGLAFLVATSRYSSRMAFADQIISSAQNGLDFKTVGIPSPNGQYVLTGGKAEDGRHDTIWLKNLKDGTVTYLLAPGNEKWPGTGGTRLLGWLDSSDIIFSWHCGSGCTSLDLVNVESRSRKFFCHDGSFFLSPDHQHAVGQSTGPYEPGDKRAGLALLTIAEDKSGPVRKACEATIPGHDQCRSDQAFESQAVNFDRWSSDSKTFSYTITPCIGGRWDSSDSTI